MSAGRALAFALAAAAAAQGQTLENDCLRAAVDTGRGGALTRIEYLPSFRFPLIADKGAGIAGSGVLFAPMVTIDGAAAVWGPIHVLQASRSEIILTANFPGIAPLLHWRRRLRLEPGMSVISIEDAVRNDSSQAHTIVLGSISLQQAEPWRNADRSWIGNDISAPEEQHLPATRESTVLPTFWRGDIGSPPAPSPGEVQVSGARVYWRQIEQYGTGFLYRIAGRGGFGILRCDDIASVGSPREVRWSSSPESLGATREVKWDSEVRVDEGGGPPDAGNAFGSVFVRSDFAAAGHVGHPLFGFATVVSYEACRVVATVTAGNQIVRRTLDLAPGKVGRIPVTIAPDRAGVLPIAITVTADGRKLGQDVAQAIVDGRPGDPVWDRFTRRLPEEHYRGTWEQIGAMIARHPSRIGPPTAFEIAVARTAGERVPIAFYGRRFPLVARMLDGAAKALGCAPSDLTITQRKVPEGHCMDVAFYGPDGPINAFSKERDGPYFQGLGYVKVLPAAGYRFHLFQHQGVNSQGLSITGADLNVDQRTKEAGDQHLRAWAAAGRHTLPYMTVGKWMLLAMCSNVAEALKLIQDPEAPLDFSGNMLLMDRSGHAARVESYGIDRQVFQSDGGRTGRFFVAGNYPHPRADGLFSIGRWPDAANTMLREAFLAANYGARQGGLGLADVMSVMQSHEAGGMCQHFFDNPGPYYSTACFIAVNRTGELYISEGPPCEVQLVRYSLDP